MPSRRLLVTVPVLFMLLPVPLQADPLGNLVQLFPIVDFFLSIACAALVWSFAFRTATGRPKLAVRRTVVMGIAALFVLAMIGLGPAAGFFLLLALAATAVASPFLCAWCALWWWLASQAYRRALVAPLPTAILGMISMIVLSSSLIWAVFPAECRRMFHQ